jgi:hypothetical protein
MAGLLARGELSAARPSFAVAGRADEADLRALLRATPTTGRVSLAFTREPDYFAGAGAGGATDTTVLARWDGRAVCMGRCSRRALYLGGELRDMGYLSELRLAPGTPRGIGVLREGFAFFAAGEAAHPAECYFTSVATTNRRARTVLESGRLGLPAYVPWADLRTLAWPVTSAAAGRTGTEALPPTGELTQFLDREARRHDLSTP